MKELDALLNDDTLRPTPGWLRGIQVGAIVGVLVGIAWLGAWRLLACPILIIPFTNLCELSKRVYWKGFDPFIWKASDEARFRAVLFWNVLTLLLDWAITLFVTLACLFLVEGVASGLGVPVTLRLFFFWCCVFPFRLAIRRGVRLVTDADVLMRGVVVFGCALLSLMVPFEPVYVVFALAATALLGIPFNIWMNMPQFRESYERLLDETRRGIVHDYRSQSSWFPRPGVVFEPQYNEYLPIGMDLFTDVRSTLTILRLNVCGFFLSLATFVGGIVWVACLGHGLLLLAVPALVPLGLLHGCLASAIDRETEEGTDWVRAIWSCCAFCGIAVLTVYLGGHDVALLFALGLLYTSSWYFFTGFLVRGTSSGVFDTLEFLLAHLSVIGVVLARRGGCIWWEALLPVLFFGFLHMRLRRHFPRTDLPDPPPEHTDSPGGRGQEDVQSRRARKRERQLSAFRRSARRATD